MSGKITPARLEILRLLANGWQIARSSRYITFGEREWMQEGEIGRGGKAKDVRAGTVLALSDLGMIRRVNGGNLASTQVFVITEKGAALVAAKCK